MQCLARMERTEDARICTAFKGIQYNPAPKDVAVYLLACLECETKTAEMSATRGKADDRSGIRHSASHNRDFQRHVTTEWHKA